MPQHVPGRRWLLVDVVLLVVAAALAVATAVTWSGSSQASTSDTSDADAVSASVLHRAVTRAAARETTAFLEVDHRDMEAVTQRVLDGATGGFAEQYAADRDRLVARVERAEAVVTSSVRVLGVAEQDDRRAVVLVAADSVVRDRDTGEEAELRKHRLRLVLEREDDAWLVAALGFAR